MSRNYLKKKEAVPFGSDSASNFRRKKSRSPVRRPALRLIDPKLKNIENRVHSEKHGISAEVIPSSADVRI
jgi:hypothetical protein